jgi:hypothetical protein
MVVRLAPSAKESSNGQHSTQSGTRGAAAFVDAIAGKHAALDPNLLLQRRQVLLLGLHGMW